MTTFTASEVRNCIQEFRDHALTVSEKADVLIMLSAFADRLEADEKAQPVTWVNPDDLHNPNFVGINAVKVGHEGLGKHYTLPLYTHPDPADAERLAEALRSIRASLVSVLCDPSGRVVIHGSDYDRKVIAKALQKMGVLVAHSAQAQPPAARVTDEMIERARSAFVQADDGSTGITDAIRAALLAAQENPNV